MAQSIVVSLQIYVAAESTYYSCGHSLNFRNLSVNCARLDNVDSVRLYLGICPGSLYYIPVFPETYVLP